MKDYDQVLDSEPDEEHLKSLYYELDAHADRLTYKTAITWMATVAMVPVALGFQFDQAWVDNVATVVLTGLGTLNLTTLVTYRIKLRVAEAHHRRWHDEHPEADHGLVDD